MENAGARPEDCSRLPPLSNREGASITALNIALSTALSTALNIALNTALNTALNIGLNIALNLNIALALNSAGSNNTVVFLGSYFLTFLDIDMSQIYCGRVAPGRLNGEIGPGDKMTNDCDFDTSHII